MQIKHGFMVKEIAGEYFAIPYDAAYESQDQMLSLNRTGAFLWQLLEEETDENTLVDTLAEEYRISRDTAQDAVSAFLTLLRENQLLFEDSCQTS